MKICHVTTFWPTTWFGFTYYTDNLIRGMRANRPEQHLVAGEGDAARRETEAYSATPCWRRQEDYVADIVRHLRSTQTDLAIIQNNPDLFGHDNRLPRLLEALRGAGIAAVVNYHSVFPSGWRTRYRPGLDAAHFDRAVAEAAACVTVHSARMRSDLLERGIDPAKVVVIPHGSEFMEKRDPVASRRALGLPDHAKIVTFFGFVWLGKGLDFLLTVFSRVARRLPDAYLYIGGYTRKRVLYTQAYMSYLQARIWGLGIKNRTRLSGGFVPDDMVPTVYAASDVVAMPYRQDYSSVSGVVHQTAGIGKLMLCSRISKFEEITEFVSPELTVEAKDVNAWVERLTRLLSDEVYAESMRQRIRLFGEQTSWEAVGKRHLALYDAILAGQSPDRIGAEWQPESQQAGLASEGPGPARAVAGVGPSVQEV